jgi:hypothetical protein
MQQQEETTTTPGVWSALTSGFDLTAKHPWLLLLPIAVDMFFWLGPRLSFESILVEIVASLPQEAQVVDLAGQLTAAGPQTNLFTVLSLPFIGVPTLLAGLAPEKTPLVPEVFDIGSGTQWLWLFLLFSAVGLLLTAVYYVTIASVVSEQGSEAGEKTFDQWLSTIGRSWLRLIGLALFFLLLALIVYLPISIVGALLFLLSSTLGTLVLLLAPIIIIWIVIYLSLAPPGITLNGRTLFPAVMDSVRLVQTNLAAMLTMLLLILLIGTLVDWLLLLVDNGTWLTLFNILGHAFVHTSLVTAFFIFYQDRTAVPTQTVQNNKF